MVQGLSGACLDRHKPVTVRTVYLEGQKRERQVIYNLCLLAPIRLLSSDRKSKQQNDTFKIREFIPIHTKPLLTSPLI